MIFIGTGGLNMSGLPGCLNMSKRDELALSPRAFLSFVSISSRFLWLMV